MIQSFKEDVTGRSLFDYRVYLFFLPVFWATSVLSNVHDDSLYSFSIWSIANVVVIAICWLLILVADKSIFRNRAVKPAHLWLVLVFATLIGAVKGSLTTYLAWLCEVEPTLDALVGRTIQASLLGLITMPALAILSATRQKFEEERQTLIAERVQLALKSGDQLVGESEVELQRLRDSLSQIRARGEAVSEVPKLLQDVVRLNLRPITHKLWERENAREKNFTFRVLTQLAMSHYPFVGLPVALIVGLGSVIPYIGSAGNSEGLLRALLTATTIYAIYWLASKVKFEAFWLGLAYFVVVNLVVTVLIVQCSKVIFGDLTGFVDITAGGVLFIWITQTGFMSSFFKGVLITRAEIRSQLEEFSKKLGIDSAVHSSAAQFSNRELANHLHANVQNKLLVLALRLERGEQVSISDELNEIEQLLSQSTSTTESVEPEELVRRWAGVAEIHIDSCVAPYPKGFTRLLSEAVNNSVRHGFAQNIWITFTESESGLQVVIRDDGIGPKSGKSGLGSKFYSSVATSWKLEPAVDGGSQLTLCLKS